MPISLFEHLYGAPKQAPNKGTDYGGAKLSADIRSQPPTAQPLTIINEAAVGQAAYGGGGGGGGLTSTISALFMPNNPAAGQGNINLVDGTGQVLAYLTQGNAYSYNASTVSTSVVVGGLSGSWGSVISGDVWVAGAGVPPGSEKAAQLTNDANGILYLNANGVSTANLQVSSINGAAPGGGGGVTPNPSFSTITMANPGSYSNVWSPTQGYINWASTLIFAQISNNQGNIYFAQGTNDTTDTSIIINSQNNSANLFLGASDVIDGTFIRSQYNKPLQLLAPIFVSSLNVSSINGAAPGGGVGAAIGTSSITASTLSFAQVSSSGLVYSGGLVNKDVFINLTPLTGQYGNSGVIGAWGKEVYQGNPGWGEFAAQRYYVTDVQGAATNAAFIQNTGNVINVQTPGSISLQAPTYISTLNVSSINGAAPGGSSSLFSTISIPGGAGVSTFGCDPNVVTQVVTFPTEVGHVYNVFVQARLTSFENVSATDSVYVELLPNGGQTLALNTAMGVNVSTLSGAGTTFEAGGSVLFKQPNNAVSTCALGVLPTFSTLIRVDGISYVDMGVI